MSTSHPDAAGADAATRRPVVLIVDDSATNLHVLNQILKQRFRVKAARSGATALQIAARDRPEAILLDVVMPEMDGPTVCRRLKQDPDTARIPVLFVTGSVNRDADELCRETGAVEVLRKPIDARELVARIMAWIDGESPASSRVPG
jgi:putative two-component system response regulator